MIMKRCLQKKTVFKICFFLFLIFPLLTQKIYAQQLVFEYDVAGNQSKRSWVCINCHSTSNSSTLKSIMNQTNKQILKQEKKLMQGAEALSWIKASPNPVTEILRVEWKADKTNALKSIEIYNISGIRVFSNTYSPSENEAYLSFSHLPSAVYILLAVYVSGKKETIKIIKK